MNRINLLFFEIRKDESVFDREEEVIRSML